jgi:hypothetical protein
MKITTQLFFPGTMTNLERMVASRAIGSSFVSTLSSETSIDRIIFEITNFHTGNNVWIFSVAAICLYGHYKYSQGMNTKLKNINIYDKYSKSIRECLILIFLVFTRDVQNAI